MPVDPFANRYRQIEQYIANTPLWSIRMALTGLLEVLKDKEPIPMADIQQALADLGDAVSGVAQRAADDHTNLQAQIDQLKAQGVDTSQLQTIADNIEGHVSALNQIDPVAQVPTDGGGATGGGATDGGGGAPPADGGGGAPPADSGGGTDTPPDVPPDAPATDGGTDSGATPGPGA